MPRLTQKDMTESEQRQLKTLLDQERKITFHVLAACFILGVMAYITGQHRFSWLTSRW